MKYFVLAFFGLALALSSCKKEGCTDLNASNFDGKAKKDDGSCKYTVPPVVIDTICDGLQVDNTFWPLYSGVFREYKNTLYGINPVVFDVTEQVLGQVVLTGVAWYEVRVTSYMTPGFPSETIEHFRKDALNGNMFRKTGATEVLIMPGIPQLGQELENGFFISDLNASKTTDECSYTECIKATKVESVGVRNIWFKRGVGRVATVSTLGEDQLTVIHD